jgi:hypothetical protein
MKKGVARAIGQLDEAEAFVSLEPFHDGVDGRLVHHRGRRIREATAAERRPRGPTLPRRLIAERTVVIEPAFARSPEISTFAHVYLLVSAKIGKTCMPNACAHGFAIGRAKCGRLEEMGCCQLNAI